MRLKAYSLIAAVGTLGLCIALPIGAQQPTPRPSNPQPSNPSPQPSNPSPQPTNPSPQPTNPQPNIPRPTNPNPNLPQQPTNPNTPVNPNDPANPNSPGRITQPTTRNQRFFAFQNPTDEARFNESAQRLVRLEQRFDRSNQDLTRRLGEIRQMSPERQNAATMDLLQQMLKSQADLQQYLVSSRSLLTGDIELSGQPTDETNPVSPSTTPSQTPRTNTPR